MGSTRERRKEGRWILRRARGLVGAGAASAYGILLFGWMWKAGWAGMSSFEVGLAFAALVVQAFAFHGGIALLGLVGVAAILRMPRTIVALVPALLWTLGPAAWSWVRPLPSDHTVDVLGVLSANVLYRNERAQDLVAQIDEHDPDVVLLQEFAPGIHADLEHLLRMRYPHARTWPQSDAFGQAVFSRIPFTREPGLWWGDEAARVPQMEFEIEFEGERIAVWNVHTLPPSGADAIRGQRSMVRTLASRATHAMRSDDAPDALIMAGDFNAPFESNHLRELRNAGFREAHKAVGRGRGATWGPGGVLGWAPKIDLDHVMSIGSVRPVRAGIGDAFGSDHLPVWATYAID